MKRTKGLKSSFSVMIQMITVLSIFLFCGKANAADQKKTITGTVTSKLTGEPLAGVAVYIEGTTFSDFTDAKGQYSLTFTAKNGTEITFQFLGMQTEKVAYIGQEKLDMAMTDDSQKLEDVVVTGYVNIRKNGFTGNTTRVTKEELTKVSPKNVISSIQVFDPSFRIVENINAGSNPNALPEFYVRGQSSVNLDVTNNADISRQNLTGNNNLPIFIMDGFEVGVEKIYDLDPNRIKTMTLLKDAAATALYGSRAANGVVVIETRAPEAGKLRVAYNMTSTVEVPDLTGYNLMNAEEKLASEVAAGYYVLLPGTENGNTTAIDNYSDYVAKYNLIKRGVNTDWLSQPVRTAINHKHSLYIDGGTENLRWSAELRYNNSNGIMKGSGRNTYGGGITLDYQIGKFQILNRTDFDVMNSEELPNYNFSDFVHLQPYLIPIDENTGKYVRTFKKYGSVGRIVNPLYEANYLNSFNRSSYNEYSNKLSANYFFNENITAKVQFSMSKRFDKRRRFIDPASASFSATTDPQFIGSLATTDGSSFSYDLNALLLFNKSIDKHYINVTGGAEIIENESESVGANYTGFPSGKLSSVNNAMRIVSKPGRASNLTRLASFLGIANYSYADIYLLDASVRLDGSSEFGKDRRTAPFWAAGAGLNVHNYEFMKKNPVISRLKLRATYGQLGKVNFPVYAAKSSYSSVSNTSWYLTGPGYMMTYLGNNDLTWEKTNSVDAGIDLGLFKDRLTLRATYYNKITTDMITSVTLPASSGFTSYMANLGKVQNKGFELDLRYTVLRANKYDLTLFGNISHNKNRILEISESLKAYNDLVDKQYADYNVAENKQETKYSVPHTKFIEGGSTTSIFAMKSLGINPANGKELFVKPDGSLTYEWNAADQVIVGDTEPLARGSFGMNARYGNFSVFASFMYHFGGQQYNSTLVNYVEDVRLLDTNADKRVLLDRWKKPGDVTMLKDISSDKSVTRPTSRFVQNDNLLRFNSMSLSYDFSPNILRKAHISMARLTAGVEDLGYWSSIRRERGLSYPFARSFNFSINLTF